MSAFVGLGGMYRCMETATCKECGAEVTATFRGMCNDCYDKWLEEQED